MSGNARPVHPPPPRLEPERFWVHVDKTGDCWVWTGSKAWGYGRFYANGPGRSIEYKAHRYAWMLAHGPIPGDLHVCHHCDNPACVKTEPDERWPDGHLFLGTDADNMRDASAKGRFDTPVRKASYVLSSETQRGKPMPRGEAHACCKIPDALVAEIRRRYADREATQVQLAAAYGISQPYVSAIVRGKHR